jgi:hypothetical protein
MGDYFGLMDEDWDFEDGDGCDFLGIEREFEKVGEVNHMNEELNREIKGCI